MGAFVSHAYGRDPSIIGTIPAIFTWNSLYVALFGAITAYTLLVFYKKTF